MTSPAFSNMLTRRAQRLNATLLSRLREIGRLGSATFAPATDFDLLEDGLVLLAGDGIVTLHPAWNLAELGKLAPWGAPCACTGGGLLGAVLTCRDCRGTGWVE